MPSIDSHWMGSLPLILCRIAEEKQWTGSTT
jgi:hypothetical protein